MSYIKIIPQLTELANSVFARSMVQSSQKMNVLKYGLLTLTLLSRRNASTSQNRSFTNNFICRCLYNVLLEYSKTSLIASCKAFCFDMMLHYFSNNIKRYCLESLKGVPSYIGGTLLTNRTSSANLIARH